jgi:hypothetical protein
VAETSTVLALAVPIAAIVFAGLAVFAAWHLWYAAGLARVLEANGAESWRAWVPLLNDAEVLRLGRIDPVKATLLLVPVVAIYGIVLRAVAAHRVNARFGHGAGSTVLAVLLPPVWAMVLAGAVLLPEDTDPSDEDDDEVGPPPVASPVAPLALVPGSPPPPPAAGAWAPPPLVAPSPAAPVSVAAPAAPAPAPIVVVAPPASAPVAAPPAASAPATAAAASVPAAPTASTARGTAAWELVLPSGEVLAMTARTIVLGRNPQMRRGEAQYVTVTDPARTVSKEHAQLQWSGEGWTISDLGSVNGVAVVDAQGVEHPVPADAAVPVGGVFLLGEARLQVRRTAS